MPRTASSLDATDEEKRWPSVIQRAITNYTRHQHRMNYPKLRTQGLPLTSSHIESATEDINIRLTGSEKFFHHDTGETLLQLRADSLCHGLPLTAYWKHWLKRQTGANTCRTHAP